MTAGGPLRVLILEDQPADAELTLAELRRFGFAPVVAAAETEAEFREALDPALDVILADYALPQFSADAALKIVQEHGLEVPFIVVSGTIGEERAAAIVREGATDYLLKDRLGRLGAAVQQAMRQRALKQEKDAAEARFQAIVEHAADIALIIDANGAIIYASPAIERMLGCSPADARGMVLTDLVHQDDELVAHGIIAAAWAEAGHPYSGEFRLRHQDGSWRWIEAIATNLRGQPAAVSGIVVNARDITERRRLEELRAVATQHEVALHREREHARVLEELAAIRADFTAMVAHELGSRIAAVRRHADLLAIEPLSESQADTLATIQREASSLQSLVADARSAATVEREDFSVTLRPVSVASLVSAAITFARTLPGDHPLTEECRVEARVRADAGRIGQVLRNLLDNAAKYAPTGSLITLRAVPAGGHVRFEVIDRGPGIAQEDLHRVFLKFKRGRSDTVRHIPGVGLGLYLSRRIVQAHGTDLTVASTPGGGAIFGFELEVVR